LEKNRRNFMNIGVQELLIILLILLLLFGARKVPDLARGLGQAFREFRKAAKEAEKEGEEEKEEKKEES
jgi:sec-independent protein translocase protein TatA